MPPFQQASLSNFCPAGAAQSTVSAVIVKWKRLGATTVQPRSGRSHKLTERDRRVLKRVARKNCVSSVATLTTEFQTAFGSNVSTNSVRRELHEMGFHGRAAVHKPKITMRNASRQPSVGWSGVKLTAIGLWSSGNAFSGVMNHASPSGFGRCQENATCSNA